MNMRIWKLVLTQCLFCAIVLYGRAQGAFQNLDFEDGVFVSIPGDPYGNVQWAPAMPGWTGYLGENTIDWIARGLSLSTAKGMSRR